MAAKPPLPRKPRNVALRPQSPDAVAAAASISQADLLRAQTRWEQLAPAPAKDLLDAHIAPR